MKNVKLTWWQKAVTEEAMYKRIFYSGTYQPCNLTCGHDLSWFRTDTVTTKEAIS